MSSKSFLPPLTFLAEPSISVFDRFVCDRCGKTTHIDNLILEPYFANAYEAEHRHCKECYPFWLKYKGDSPNTS